MLAKCSRSGIGMKRKVGVAYLVAFGSLWNVLPLLAGPMIIQRESGRCAPRTLKRSSPKHDGGQYAASLTSFPTAILSFSTKARSKR